MNLRRLYATILQGEYLLALAASYLLGAEKWLPFAICLLLTIAIGFVSNDIYWRIQQRIARKAPDR